MTARSRALRAAAGALVVLAAVPVPLRFMTGVVWYDADPTESFILKHHPSWTWSFVVKEGDRCDETCIGTVLMADEHELPLDTTYVLLMALTPAIALAAAALSAFILLRGRRQPGG